MLLRSDTDTVAHFVATSQQIQGGGRLPSCQPLKQPSKCPRMNWGTHPSSVRTLLCSHILQPAFWGHCQRGMWAGARPQRPPSPLGMPWARLRPPCGHGGFARSLVPLEGELTPVRQRCSWRMRARSSVQGVYGTAHPLHPHTAGLGALCKQKTLQMVLGQSLELAASTGHKQGGGEPPPFCTSCRAWPERSTQGCCRSPCSSHRAPPGGRSPRRGHGRTGGRAWGATAAATVLSGPRAVRNNWFF